MKILTLIFGLLISGISYGQITSVKGSVLDGGFNKEPLAFANVKVKGLDINAETTLDGDFELNLLEGKYTLIIEFTGYASLVIEEVAVSDSQIILEPVILNAVRHSYDLASTQNNE